MLGHLALTVNTVYNQCPRYSTREAYVKLGTGVEQSIYAIVMLERQQPGVPVKAPTIARLLGVSESYLRKITRKLVVAGLLSSKADRAGGLFLARPLGEITFLDVVRAVEGDGPVYDPRVFSTMTGAGTEGFAKRESAAVGVFAEATRAMEDVLASHTLDEVAIDEYGPVDWNAIVAQK